jgi:hypothetical protein
VAALRISPVFGLLALLSGCSEELPRPSLAAYCGRFCARTEIPHCKADAADCDVGCVDEFSATPSRCESALQALLDCAVTANYRCDADGLSYTGDCVAVSRAYSLCTGDTTGSVDVETGGNSAADAGAAAGVDAASGSSGGGGDAGGSTGGSTGSVGTDGGTTGASPYAAQCADFCKHATGLGCAFGATNDACTKSCLADMARISPSCGSEAQAMASCFASATVLCDTEGVPTTSTCDAAEASFYACQAGLTSAPVCSAPASTEPCTQCGSQACCRQIVSCGADCQAYLACVSQCTGTEAACASNCAASATAASQSAALALSNCVVASCASACQ